MPIVYIHGVAIRDDDEALAKATKRFREVPWETIREHLRATVAPAISDNPADVPITRIYWGDLGARFAWGGSSLVSRNLTAEVASTAVTPPEGESDESDGPDGRPATPTLRERGIRRMRSTVTAFRRPLEEFVPIFLGDVLTYVAWRGAAGAPGPIPQRILDGLETASTLAESRREPLIVLTHSMGGQILYDVLTHFAPRTPRYQGIRVDYWCATGSQVGFFEELKLFLESDPAYSAASGRRVPPMPGERLGGWWNVWDHADLLSFRAGGIFEGVDDAAFFAAGALPTDHFKYLGSAEFYRMFATRVRASLESRCDNDNT
ncbi:MAG: hypothetical protein L0H25_01115 [Micrococcales bacterium]|nr:hypothetical protein [Micrococcales bacterium]